MNTMNTQDACDVIVLGGGENGLLCAAYLARTGAKTVLLERHTKWGSVGNLGTDEFQGPYRFDRLPPYLMVMGERAPCYQDLELAQRSLAYITPAVQIAFHRRDGRALVLHRDPEKSAAAIGNFCAADAQRFLAMYGEFQQLCEEILMPSLYAVDGDAGAASRLGATALGKRLAALSALTPADIVASYGFENPQVREAILYLATFWGLDPNEAGIGQVAVLWVYSLLNSAIVKSGNVAAAKALYQRFMENGGDYPGDSLVERILVENGKAVGVRLNNGRVIRARAIVSTLDVEETFLGLVDRSQLPRGLSEACQHWEWQESSLLTCHFGYKGMAPSYQAASYDAAANEAYINVFGVETAGDVGAIFQAIRKGDIPQGHGRAICATQFDEFHAGFEQVEGPLQTLRFEVPVPGRLAGRAWKDAHAACAQTALETWKRYTNDFVKGPLSYTRVMTPHELQRSLPSFKQGSFLGGKYTAARLGYGTERPACAKYRSDIAGLYLGGAAAHPGGLIHFAAGYNAAGLVTQDLQLNHWWNEPASVRTARVKGYLPEIG